MSQEHGQLNRIPLLYMGARLPDPKIEDYERWRERFGSITEAIQQSVKQPTSGISTVDLDIAQFLAEIQPGQRVLVLPKTIHEPPESLTYAALIGRVNPRGTRAKKEQGDITIISKDPTHRAELALSLMRVIAGYYLLRPSRGSHPKIGAEDRLKTFPPRYQDAIRDFVSNPWADHRTPEQMKKGRDERSRNSKARDLFDDFYRSFAYKHMSGDLPRCLAGIPDGSFDTIISLERLAAINGAVAEVNQPIFMDELGRLLRGQGSRIMIRETTARGLVNAEYIGSKVWGEELLPEDFPHLNETTLWRIFQKRIARGAGISYPTVVTTTQQPAAVITEAPIKAIEAPIPQTADEVLNQKKNALASWLLAQVKPLVDMEETPDDKYEAALLAASAISVLDIRRAGPGYIGAWLTGFNGEIDSVVRAALTTTQTTPSSNSPT